jgi:15-cis-phytoene synthase
MHARAEAPAAPALARLYSLPPQRAALSALLGIEAEINASVRPGMEHAVAHARLRWWREECARCTRGDARHPLTRALASSLGAAPPEALAGLGGLVDTATWDLAHATFESRPELDGYCQRWSGAMLEPLVRLAAPASTAAAALGMPLRELELLLAVVPEARAGKVRLPLDELERAGADPAALARPPFAAALTLLLQQRHQLLRRALAEAVVALAPALQAQLRGLLVWVALTSQHSRAAERALPAAALNCDHHAPLDGWRAWRAARRAAAGRSRLSR